MNKETVDMVYKEILNRIVDNKLVLRDSGCITNRNGKFHVYRAIILVKE